MNKIQKGGWALQEAQLHCGIKDKRLFTPVSTRFSYLIHLLRSLTDNKPVIEYLYGSMPGIHDNICASRPSLDDWYFIQIIVTSMNRIVVSIILDQCNGEE